MIQWLVEHIHVYAGTPWWATIMISAAVLRVGLFKLFSDASDQGARMALLKDTYRPLSAKIKAAKEAKDQVMIMSLTNDLRVLWKDAGVKPWKGFLPILIQIPFGFGTFRLLRNMYEVPVPGMVDGGVLWFQDLTVADPLLILPISMGVVSYFTMKVLGPNLRLEDPILIRCIRLLRTHGFPPLLHPLQNSCAQHYRS